MDEADLSLLQLPGYTLISQSTICSSHGGLAIYPHATFNYTLLPIYKRSIIWEGLLIEIEGKQLSKNVFMGNMYRPPRDRNGNYQSFINEIDPVLTTLGNFKWEIILTGDLNINLLNVNVKPIFNEFLDIITSHSFYPHITLPTRLSRRSGTLIDNFFCKFTCSLSDVSFCIFTSGISDHFPYCISIIVTRAIIDPNKYIYVNNHPNEALNHFKTEITSACLVEQIDSDPNLDPNHNYNIIEKKLTEAKQKHLQCKIQQT